MADRALESLLDEHLLQQETPGRYRLHDLLCGFAARRCRHEAGANERRTATSRLYDWYVLAADTASARIRRFPLRVDMPIPWSATPGPELSDQDAAIGWFDAECANLLAALHAAADEGCHVHAVHLAHLLRPYLVRRHHLTEWVTTQQVGLAAAEHLGDETGQAHSLVELGHGYLEAGRLDRSMACLRRALALYRRLDDMHGVALVQLRLGYAHRRTGRYDEAIACYRAALDGFRRLDGPARQANTKSGLAMSLYLAGRHREALDHLHQALELDQRCGGAAEAGLRTNLGLLCARVGRHPDAIEHAERALTLYRDAHSQPGEATNLANLCLSYAHLGRHADALDVGGRALALGRRLTCQTIEATALNNLAAAHRVAGNHEASLRDHRAALAATAHIPEVYERQRAEQCIAEALTAIHSG